MSAGLDRSHIRRAFGRAASSYAAHSPLQAEVAARLREHLDGFPDVSPRRIVDVGCGPGEGCVALRARYPHAELIALDLALPMLREVGCAGSGVARDDEAAGRLSRVCADAQALPLADASVDLVHSSLCLQWCDDPGLALAEFRRVLRPEGLLLFSTFGPDTLNELRAAFAEVDQAPHVSRFIDMHDIGDGLLASGFRDPVLEREDFTLTYADARSLMRELRAIGATNADARRQRSLTGKAHLARVEAAYERFRSDGVLPATYEVVYAIARAPAPGQPRRDRGGDVASFPLERLRGSRRRP
ncbi:malonyl-ACP O-methyltransferase BioC [Dokdonella sp.]|uniref:malonyl-ACP O-methyltransferase BioC n=1 Tax=Dokdonella sp. TaxID=2291710 RepID=UPI002F3E7193